MKFTERLKTAEQIRFLFLGNMGSHGLDLLEKIEKLFSKRYQKVNFCLSEYFEIFGGVDQGCPIATGLAYGLSVTKIRAFMSQYEAQDPNAALKSLRTEMSIIEKSLESGLVTSIQDKDAFTPIIENLTQEETLDFFDGSLDTAELLMVDIGLQEWRDGFEISGDYFMNNNRVFQYLHFPIIKKNQAVYFKEDFFPPLFDIKVKTDLENFDLEGFLGRNDIV